MPIAPEIKKLVGVCFLKIKHWLKLFVIITVVIFVLVNLIMSIISML